MLALYDDLNFRTGSGGFILKVNGSSYTQSYTVSVVFNGFLGELRGTFNTFPDFFVQAFKIVVDS